MGFETFTKGMQDANEVLNRNFAAVETQLNGMSIQLYVSINGSDESGDGTQDKPKYQQPYYQRNAFGEVTIWGAVKKDSAIEKSDVIATLPKGFWPPAPFEAPAMKFVDGAPTAVMVFVHGNGQISTSSTTSTGSAALSFIITYAGQ